MWLLSHWGTFTDMLLYGKNPTDPGVPLAEERVQLPSGPTAVETARHRVQDALRAWGWEERAHVASQCVSELVTDLTTAEPDTLTLILRQREDHIRIMLRAAGDGCRIHELTGEATARGRSFALVDRLAPLWGVIPRADGDMVWVEFDRVD